ncbi:response regulator [Motiliproteus sp.]|uniref:response regulator n=1 Tax=Motiliproteus sp. TaxID=1898955 RepID=UPI003BA9109F
MESAPTIMVVVAEVGDTDVLRHILDSEYQDVVFETNPDEAASAFVQLTPAVLMMAFSEISAAERFYLGLFRSQDNAAAIIPHQTVVLCSSKETDLAYELCRKRVFDHYVAFRPLLDPNQIKLSIDQALERNRLHSEAGAAGPIFQSARNELSTMENLVSSAVDAARNLERESERSADQLSKQMDTELEALHQLIVQRQFDGAIQLVDESSVGQHLDAFKGRLHELKRQSLTEGTLSDWLNQFEQEARAQLDKINHQVQPKRQRLILVVEDDEFVRRVYQHVLSKAGFKIVFAEDGYTALRHLNQQLPDLILMDIMLPDIDGIEATRRIKQEKRFKEIPIVIASGRAERKMVKDGIAAGACDFVVKPINEKVLLGKLNHTLSL